MILVEYRGPPFRSLTVLRVGPREGDIGRMKTSLSIVDSLLVMTASPEASVLESTLLRAETGSFDMRLIVYAEMPIVFAALRYAVEWQGQQ